jgi:hypothetical protein
MPSQKLDVPSAHNLSTLAASATTSYLRHHAALTPALQQHAAVHGYTTAYWTATAIFTAGALLSALLYRSGRPRPRRPHQHRPRLTTAPPQPPWAPASAWRRGWVASGRHSHEPVSLTLGHKSRRASCL